VICLLDNRGPEEALAALLAAQPPLLLHDYASDSCYLIKCIPDELFFYGYDPEVELAKLSKKFSIAHPKWACSQGNEITHYCINDECSVQSAMMCGSTSCSACAIPHQECGLNAKLAFIVW
jgi:hypothetical protein